MSIKAIQSLTDIKDVGTKLILSSKNPKNIVVKPIESGSKKLFSSLEQMATTNIPAIQKLGKHKIPRFLYHFTDENSLKKIMQDGKIKPYYPNNDMKGIFMVDMNNFLKYWKIDGSWSLAADTDMSLLANLVSSVQHGKGNIACIKIPTNALDTNKLKIRSQNRLAVVAQLDTTPLDTLAVSAQKASLYNQKKEAIEYIYDSEIPVDIAKIIMPIKAKGIEEYNTDGISQHKAGLEILQSLFKGEPEQIGIEAQLKDIVV